MSTCSCCQSGCDGHGSESVVLRASGDGPMGSGAAIPICLGSTNAFVDCDCGIETW